MAGAAYGGAVSSRGLVLSGGGVGGIAWLLGLITGLRDEGVDLTRPDVLVGTSAGAAVAAQLATRQLDTAAAMQLEARTAEIPVVFDGEAFVAEVTALMADAGSRLEAVRRLANLEPRSGVAPGRRRSAVAARLPVQEWPDGPLRLAAVEQATGRRRTFDARSGVALVDAVTASCAVPGVWPPVEVDGRRYVDGGTWSSTNADLAEGADRVVVLVPSALQPELLDVLAAEQESLAPASTLVVSVDEESLAAIGPNALDPARRPLAYRAGRRQAGIEAAALRTFWV